MLKIMPLMFNKRDLMANHKIYFTFSLQELFQKTKIKFQSFRGLVPKNLLIIISICKTGLVWTIFFYTN